MDEEVSTALTVFIVMILIAASGWFWHTHGQMIEECLRKGGTQEYCWSLLR